MIKEISLREASLRYTIPKSTLQDRTSALIRGEEAMLRPQIGKFNQPISPEYETGVNCVQKHQKVLAAKAVRYQAPLAEAAIILTKV
ncbi:unnamed protein product [Danaus chrysippus]|uniref:(African queen) hypothetical protein n=1 Tax=Danaus chrysippus TaxID=151541 RepID=A0A8J2W9P5_9NEOP|nr:unnamed protein product [Danaus chrysippus]